MTVRQDDFGIRLRMNAFNSARSWRRLCGCSLDPAHNARRQNRKSAGVELVTQSVTQSENRGMRRVKNP
jgi:hypothetical protein